MRTTINTLEPLFPAPSVLANAAQQDDEGEVRVAIVTFARRVHFYSANLSSVQQLPVQVPSAVIANIESYFLSNSYEVEKTKPSCVDTKIDGCRGSGRTVLSAAKVGVAVRRGVSDFPVGGYPEQSPAGYCDSGSI